VIQRKKPKRTPAREEKALLLGKLLSQKVLLQWRAGFRGKPAHVRLEADLPKPTATGGVAHRDAGMRPPPAEVSKAARPSPPEHGADLVQGAASPAGNS
jgi:hypothetical protein